MFTEELKVTGAVEIQLFAQDGSLKESVHIKNLVVTAGKGFIASRMTGTPAIMSHMAIGSGTSAAVGGDGVLGGELGRVTLASGVTAGTEVTYNANFPAGTGTGAVTEAGIFNAGSAGTMLCRTVFAVVNKGADDAMSITWKVTVS